MEAGSVSFCTGGVNRLQVCVLWQGEGKRYRRKSLFYVL